MHMADALLTPAVAGVMYAASAVVAGASIVELHKEEKQDLTSAAKKLPTMAVMSALVFAGQMINYTIPGTGSSGRLLGAFSVVLETTLSGITDLPFGAFCAIMQPIHLAIGLIEGLITAAVLLFLYEARPELLRDVRMSGETTGKVSFKGTIAVIAIAAVLVGGGLSLLASGNPDGLEWSLFGNSDAGYTQNMGLDEDSYGVQSSAADKAGTVQEKTAFLPDYSFTGSDSAAGTSVQATA